MEIEHLYAGLRQFREEVLAELREIREELRQLRAGSAAPSPHQPDHVAALSAPDPLELLQQAPAGLRKRLQPLIGAVPDHDDRARVLWLLEVSENVEDFVRYEGDDWPECAEFLQALQQVQRAWGLQRISPQEGEPVDPSLHLVLQSLPGPERRDQVARCARAGYAHQGEILRRAEVVVYL